MWACSGEIGSSSTLRRTDATPFSHSRPLQPGTLNQGVSFQENMSGKERKTNTHVLALAAPLQGQRWMNSHFFLETQNGGGGGGLKLMTGSQFNCLPPPSLPSSSSFSSSSASSSSSSCRSPIATKWESNRSSGGIKKRKRKKMPWGT